jgi:hypothetical protein
MAATMSMATATDTQSPALRLADSHDLIRVHGARENNLKDVSVEIPKRRLTPTPTRCCASSSPTRQAVRRLAQRVLFQCPLGPRGRADLDREGRREDRETRVRRRMSQERGSPLELRQGFQPKSV